MATRNKPAAGASGGADPLLAAIHLPDFMRLEAHELAVILNILRDSLSAHLYLLLLTQMHYTSGEFLSTYARLMDLMTPPRPERGRRLPGPSYQQVRRALQSLIDHNLVKRSTKNEEQGQLRLRLVSRAKPKNIQNVLARPTN